MKCSFIVGEKIYLKPLELEDLNQNYLGWINDEEVTRFMEVGIFPTNHESLKSWWSKIQNSNNDVVLAVVDKKTNKHIGNVKLGSINWIHRNAHYGIMIGDKSFWGKGICKELDKMILNYAFNTLNLNRIYIGFVCGHVAVQKCHEKSGFELEGKIKQHMFINGEYVDMIMMGITKERYNEKG